MSESPMAAGTRRSSRNRRPVQSIYDDARESFESSQKSKRISRKDDDDDTDEDQEKFDMEVDDDDDDDDTSSSDGSRGKSTPRRGTPRKVSTSSTGKSPTTQRTSRYVSPTHGVTTMSPTTPTPRKRKGTNVAGRQRHRKKANFHLHDEETPESSILAAIISVTTASSGMRSRKRTGFKKTETTEQMALRTLARKIVLLHRQDRDTKALDDNDDASKINNNNSCVQQLVTFLLRCVGGNQSSLPPVEDWTPSQRADILNQIVHDMEVAEHSPLVPLVADPSSLSERNFRSLYEQFWYCLGEAAVDYVASASHDSDDDNEEEDDVPATQQTRTSTKNAGGSFLETLREIMQHVMEFSHVGVAEIRHAAAVAIYQMGLALVKHTAELRRKHLVAERQHKASIKSKQSRKAAALKDQMDGWNKTETEIKDFVESTIIAVFLKRYKDVRPQIRATSIQQLVPYLLERPDWFLQNSYLKYIGWSLSDKDPLVRQTALQAFLRPLSTKQLDCGSMTMAVQKFLPRLTDMTRDVDPTVQETAMELFVILLRKGFLDDLDDDHVWSQLNLRALAPDATEKVRYQALLFVLDQLEAFDKPAKSEQDMLQRINELVQWIAHNLSDSEIPVEHVRYELTDFVVMSLRASPEHKSLVCNWSTLMMAMQIDNSVPNDDEAARALAVRQRVLLRFVVYAAKMEVTEATSLFQIDADLVSAMTQHSSKKSKTTTSHEELTLALLKALPDLLALYKGETAVLKGLTSLPQYFLPSVFNLPSRKKDFMTLLDRLAEVLTESTDLDIMNDCALALTSLAQGDHNRVYDAQCVLQKTVRSIQDRLLELFLAKAEGSAVDCEMMDVQHSITLCLRRLAAIAQRIYIGELLSDNVGVAQDEVVEELFKTVAEYIAKELYIRRVVGENKLSEIWNESDETDNQIHSMVAEAVSEAFTFLLCTMAWRLHTEIDLLDSGKPSTGDPDNHIVVRMRDSAIKLVALCFEQHLESPASCPKHHQGFAFAVEKQGVQMLTDMRSLFPRAWASSTVPLLSKCALLEADEGVVRSGMLQLMYLKAVESKPDDDETNVSTLRDLLLPFTRGLVSNWAHAGRKEAGIALAYFVGHGAESSRLIGTMSKIAKKIDPLRLLEAHMLCLVELHDDWIIAEPGELESEFPTDEELQAFEVLEKKHAARFEEIEQLASRLSASLGVGKIRDSRMSASLTKFFLHGINHAFSFNNEYPVGSRLSFLRIFSKYLSWIRRDRIHKKAIADSINKLETDLRNHPEYGSIFEEDLDAIAYFRKCGDLGSFYVEDESIASVESAHNETKNVLSQLSPASQGSSIHSYASSRSQKSIPLPPVHEEDEDDSSEGDGNTPAKRLKTSANDDYSVETSGK